MQLAEDIILKKRDGLSLTQAEIRAFIDGVSRHTVSDAQIAAFAMATFFNGMNLDEERDLTLAMRDSGTVLTWENLDGPVLDKHSTGGVGDLVSLLLGPIVASCGAYVPMISGRGLGHTGGTLDKLDSIPGFDTLPGRERFQQLVRENGIAIIGQTNDLAPADRRIYAVRDVTATVASSSLIISSILSKKLAEGLDALVMDIKFGSGAFTPEPEKAVSLARDISRVAYTAGLPCNALVTDMDQPLAWSAGNALEVHEAITFLKGDAQHARLATVVEELSAELLLLGGLASSPEESRKMVLNALESGRAAEQFATMVSAQGGPSNLLNNPELFLPAAAIARPVYSTTPGYVSAIDTKAIGTVVISLGGGRQRVEDAIDPSVGISKISGVGSRVDSNVPLAFIHASREEDWDHAAQLLRSAYRMSGDAVEVQPAIFAQIEGKSDHE
ncbi:thymidine phosphorylase [Pseudomonadota bacterium]